MQERRGQEKMRRRGKERADKQDLKVWKVTKAIADKKMANEAEVQKTKRAILEKATGDEKRDAKDPQKKEAGRRAAVEVVLAERGEEAAAANIATKGKAAKGEKVRKD